MSQLQSRSLLVYPRLAAVMAEQDVTAGDLASRAGCATGTIRHLLRGRARASLALKARIADALNEPVEDLFELAPAVRRLVDAAVAQGFGVVVEDPATIAQVGALLTGRDGRTAEKD